MPAAETKKAPAKLPIGSGGDDSDSSDDLGGWND